jgi:hypothetical protein
LLAQDAQHSNVKQQVILFAKDGMPTQRRQSSEMNTGYIRLINAANHRETCIDYLYFDENGKIKPVKITREGVKASLLK